MTIYALFLFEGETEEEFYKRLADLKYKGLKKKTKNLRGNTNINAKILDAFFGLVQKNPNDKYMVFVCIDRERENTPPFNKDFIETKLGGHKNYLGLTIVECILMLESIFFIDIDGIYKFLGTKKSNRNPKKYSNFRRLTHHDLSALFKSEGKQYVKGRRSANFISNLDVEKIADNAPEISRLVKNTGKLLKKQ